MKTIDEIKINAKSSFISDKSSIKKSIYFFMYRVTIINNSDKKLQLTNRHWHISDANDNTQVIDGEGVIGEQPILNPGDSFKYTSFCPIKTEFGTMSGYYTFKEVYTSELYKGIIPEFILVTPTQVN